MKTLADIFEHTLQDVYYAENAITKALPKVAKAAKSAELKKAAEDHLAETKDQIKKLDQVFKSIGKKASGEKCDAIEGLIKEADSLMEEAEGTALDAGLLAACQAVEHYEIARYQARHSISWSRCLSLAFSSPAALPISGLIVAIWGLRVISLAIARTFRAVHS